MSVALLVLSFLVALLFTLNVYQYLTQRTAIRIAEIPFLRFAAKRLKALFEQRPPCRTAPLHLRQPEFPHPHRTRP